MDLLAEKRRLQELRQQYHIASETETQKQLAARSDEIRAVMQAIEDEILRGCIRPQHRKLSGMIQTKSYDRFFVVICEIGCSAVGDETSETRPHVKADSRDEAVEMWNDLVKNWKGEPL